MSIVTTSIDTRDYVNGIGNRSREQYVCIERWPRIPCYSEADMALSSSTCTSVDVLASKRRQTQSSETEEQYQQVL